MQLVGNKDFVYRELGRQVEITVRPFYVPEKSAPETEYFFFAYAVEITNLSPEPLQLINRHWIIRDGRGAERYVNGEGVIGQRPVIEPGETFEYTSFCPLSTPTGNMRGKYEMKDPEGNRFWAQIPVFFFRRPESFH